jgi:hypothetical protein
MTMTSLTARICLGLVISTTVNIAAINQSVAQNQATEEQRQACTPDVFRLCSAEIPNVTKIVACLKKEKPKLSAGCRAAMS